MSKTVLMRWDIACVVLLILLGIFHIPIQWMSDRFWEDPVSFRKPILFGISTGLTLGSLILLLDSLRPHRWDPWLRGLLCTSLSLEVLLITIQPWRGEPSHFNRNGSLNATIELVMLLLILAAVVAISFLTVRACLPNAFRDVSRALMAANRWGMVFLLLSCGLGIWITWVGHSQQALGKPPEVFGERGVLKFPHGATLHAIQTLVIWAWICDWIRSRSAWQSVTWLAIAHGFLLAFSLRQTLLGRGRWEVDFTAWGIVAGMIVAGIFALGFAFRSRT